MWKHRISSLPFCTWKYLLSSLSFSTLKHRLSSLPFSTWKQRLSKLPFFTWKQRISSLPFFLLSIRCSSVAVRPLELKALQFFLTLLPCAEKHLKRYLKFNYSTDDIEIYIQYILTISPKYFKFIIKVFPSTNCFHRGEKDTCFGKSVKVLTREFQTFTIKSLQYNTYNVIGKLNVMKI